MAWKVVKWGGFGETATLQCECVCACRREVCGRAAFMFWSHVQMYYYSRYSQHVLQRNMWSASRKTLRKGGTEFDYDVDCRCVVAY